MIAKLDDVWTTRDYPVLIKIVEAVDRDEWISLHQLVERTGKSGEECFRAVRALETAELVLEPSYSSGPDVSIGRVSREAYRVTGLHPDPADAAASLIQLLEQAADRSPDPVEKSKLKQAALAVGDLGSQVIGNVLGALLARMAGVS